jgi:site-specific DNA-methyltransferase (adenine-specific)
LSHQIHTGDNRDILKTFDENSLDGCVTDPPYGMAMEDWDGSVPKTETWQEVIRVLKPGAFCLSFCSPELYHRMASNVEQAGFRILDMINWIVTTKMAKTNRLKPAHEPIVVAQKPFRGTIKQNSDEWGVGTINIDGARVPWEGRPPTGWTRGGHQRRVFGKSDTRSDRAKDGTVDANPDGRYPSDVVGHFDQPDIQKYFYAPRVTRKEKGEYNDHPTVKPINLMRYLVRIYTPAGGKVLDPFNGTGTTGIASIQEGRSYVGIELSEHYRQISEKRIQDHCSDPANFERLFDYEG